MRRIIQSAVAHCCGDYNLSLLKFIRTLLIEQMISAYEINIMYIYIYVCIFFLSMNQKLE